jgi:hypothetical protein
MQILWLVLAWLLLAGGDGAWATAQLPDRLIYEGKEQALYSNPLESYYGKENPRPKFQMWHTANYRGYVATWEIDQGVLYLKAIRARMDGKEVGLDYLFPGHPGRVEARWFSGRLRVPQGKMLHYVHQGYAQVFEQELFITIKDGKVMGTETIDNRDKFPEKK